MEDLDKQFINQLEDIMEELEQNKLTIRQAKLAIVMLYGETRHKIIALQRRF